MGFREQNFSFFGIDGLINGEDNNFELEEMVFLFLVLALVWGTRNGIQLFVWCFLLNFFCLFYLP